jgi:hypothetical protein
MAAGLVVRDQMRDADRRSKRDSRRRPPTALVRLLGRVDDAEHRPAVGQVQPDVPAAAHVARQDLEGNGIVPGPSRERRKARELRGQGRGPVSRDQPFACVSRIFLM